jgi:hypothetical protein
MRGGKFLNNWPMPNCTLKEALPDRGPGSSKPRMR